MDIFQIKEGRYLLYLDILGFSKLVRTQSPEIIYNTIDHLVNTYESIKTFNQCFGILYFSDTILFYQKSKGWGSWAFCDVYALSGLIWTSLAAKKIPSRGAIVFGDFNVLRDSSDSHDLFWGNALIEANKMEQANENRDFIGITLSPKAWQAVEYMEEGTIKAFTSEDVFREHHNDQLQLNPFWHLRHVYNDYLIGEVIPPYTNWYTPRFPNELKALSYIIEYKDDDPKINKKYKHTSSVFKEMISPESFAWYLDVYNQELR